MDATPLLTPTATSMQPFKKNALGTTEYTASQALPSSSTSLQEYQLHVNHLPIAKLGLRNSFSSSLW